MAKFLIYPLFTMVLLTFGVAAVMFRTRVQAARAGLPLRHFKTFSEGHPTEAMLKTSQHFTNLFELPVLFYAGCLAAIQMQTVGFTIHLWAWLFVASRIAHAIVHIGSNKVMHRMRIYLISWVAVLAIWVIVVAQLLRD